jgi:tight adherence protein C
MLLVAGACAIVVGVVVAVAVATAGGGEPTGVARSLAIIEQGLTPSESVRSDLPARERLLAPLLVQTRSLAYRLSPSTTTDRLGRLLDRAGNPSPWTIERLMAVKGAGVLLGVVLGLLLGKLQATTVVWVAVLGSALFFLPDLLIYNISLKRQDLLGRGLAEALDMLTVCVEAGQGFDAAILQVARSVEGPIAGEFARVLAEIQIGRSRGDAFASLGERVSVAEVKNFVSALSQADQLGLPIAAVLRQQTSQMRLARRQRAEEAAQKVTVKILFPLMFCIFPALFVVILGPGVIRMVRMFTGLGG